jgi:hypothetical protein
MAFSGPDGVGRHDLTPQNNIPYTTKRGFHIADDNPCKTLKAEVSLYEIVYCIGKSKVKIKPLQI